MEFKAFFIIFSVCLLKAVAPQDPPPIFDLPPPPPFESGDTKPTSVPTTGDGTSSTSLPVTVTATEGKDLITESGINTKNITLKNNSLLTDNATAEKIPDSDTSNRFSTNDTSNSVTESVSAVLNNETETSTLPVTSVTNSASSSYLITSALPSLSTSTELVKQTSPISKPDIHTTSVDLPLPPIDIEMGAGLDSGLTDKDAELVAGPDSAATDNASTVQTASLENVTVSDNATATVKTNETTTQSVDMTTMDERKRLTSTGDNKKVINDTTKETADLITETSTAADIFKTTTLDSSVTTSQPVQEVITTERPISGEMTTVESTSGLDNFGKAVAVPVDLPPPPIDFGPSPSDTVPTDSSSVDPLTNSQSTLTDPFLAPDSPVDSPSVVFSESPGSTTIEISDLFAGLGDFGALETKKKETKGQTEVGNATRIAISTKTTTETSFSEEPLTTTVTPSDQTIQGDFTLPGSDSGMTKKVVQSRITKDFGDTATIPPDHPPPIFSGSGRPTVYTDEFGPHTGRFPAADFTPSRPLKVYSTTTQPPPPIIVPKEVTKSRSRLLPKYETTTPGTPKWMADRQKQAHGLINPRFMNVAELAAYALKISKPNERQRGIQVFFPAEPETTTLIPTSTVSTARAPGNVWSQQRSTAQKPLPNAFVAYLREKYGLNNVVPTTTKPMITTAAPPARRPLEKPGSRRFFDSQYLLSRLSELQPTTKKPVARKFFDSSYLLSHLDELNKRGDQTGIITTAKPVPRTFYPASYLLSHLNELPKPEDMQQTKGGLVQNQRKSLDSQLTNQIGTRDQTRSSNKQETSVPLRPNLQTWLGNIKPTVSDRIGAEQNIIKEQRQGQTETRPLSLRTDIKPQSIVTYNTTPERNVRMNINLKPDINQWMNASQADSFQRTGQPASFLIGSTAAFQPVVYGSQHVQSQHRDKAQKLKERFNRKWYHPEEEGVKPQVPVQNRITQNNVVPTRDIKIQIDATNLQTADPNVDLQRAKLEEQKRLLEEQENRLRVQLQMLKQQQELLLQRQQQEQLMRQQQLLREQQENLQRQSELEQQLQQQLLRRQQQEVQILEGNVPRQQLPQQRRIPDPETNTSQFPLASRLGESETQPVGQVNLLPAQHIYKPEANVQLSSIQIFRAPALLHKKPENRQSRAAHLQTHWQVPSDLAHLHGHLAVPYHVQPVTISQETSVQTTSRPIAPTNPAAQMFVFTTQPPIVTSRRPITTTLPRPTEPVTADPNPPPIFDIKIRHTFMPMPKIERTTKGPKSDKLVSGWDDSMAGNPNFDSRCRGCVFVNDRCLLPHPEHCNLYIECVKQGSSVRAFDRECAIGSFFDRKSFLCVDPKNADCPTDRCRNQGTKWYGVHGHCKHYWACGSREGGIRFAQSECCPDMGGFSETEGCIQDHNCTDTCNTAAVVEKPTAGTCLPMLSLTFDEGRIADSSNTKQHLQAEGISVTRQGEAIYKGDGRVVVWRYANLMLPVIFAIQFRFLSTSSAPRYQSLFSNCDTKDQREPSIEISLDTGYSEVIFKVDTNKGPAKRFTIIYQQNTWNTVDLIYDGERIVGAVDRRARNIFAGGMIETRPSPISVGSCDGKDGFKGLLDDVYIYEDCIPDEMYGIFLSVLE